MNNGIFPLGAPPSYTPISSSQNLLGIPTTISMPYGYPANKKPEVNYNNLVFVIDTQKSSGSNRIFSISLEGTVSCFIDWGDGLVERFTTTGAKSHTYPSFGEYTIQIYGTLTGFSMLNAGTNRLPLTKCLSFGTLALTSFDFHSCSNLVQVPDNIPTGVTTLNNALYACTSFNWPINSWNTSRITSMAFTLSNCTIFNQDLNMWDTRNVTSFNSCFSNASRFNKPISSWNVGKCSNFNTMFYGCSSFNQDISNWNIGSDSSVTSIDMGSMFYGASIYNQNHSNWDMSKVTSINSMFYSQSNNSAFTAFNGTVSGWNLTKCTDVANAFTNCIAFNKPLNWINTSGITSLNGFLLNASSFNQSLQDLDVSKVSAFNSCLQGATSFNQPLSGWNIGGNASVTTINMSYMFSNATSFNQPLDSWDVSKVNNFSSMFASSNFNGSLSGWQIGSGTGVTSVNMAFMFNGASAFNNSVANWTFYKPTSMNDSFYNTASFNHPSITGWINTSGITNMGNMFYNNRVFNQPIGSWDTSNVTNMNNTFNFCLSFNQSLNSWNVSKVTNFAGMFATVAINQPFNNWDIKGITAAGGMDSFLTGATLSTGNYNNILIDWESRKSTYRTDLRPHFGASKYTASGSAAATARASLVAYGWTITDGGSIIGAPDAPTAVTGTGGDAQVSLSWTAPIYNNGSNITDYAIQYSSNSGSSWTLFSDGVSTSTSTTVTGLINETSYIFRVAAINAAGTGNYSSNSSSVTPVAAVSFTPTAVILTAGSSYTVPAGATSMKAWAIGGGGGGYALGGGAGGTAYKTWSVSGGNTVNYTIGGAGVSSSSGSSGGGNSTVTFNSQTITGNGGADGSSGTGGGYSGGDGGANGGNGIEYAGISIGGAVGGNGQSLTACSRRPASDVSNLFAAVILADGNTTESCGSTAAFGSSGAEAKYITPKAAGLGGGGAYVDSPVVNGGGGCVVLYFT